MKLDSKYFDKIRVTPRGTKPEPKAEKSCEWEGCDKPARHKAPKGRGFEGQFWNYCTAHVQEYNKSYNYFAGMTDGDVTAAQRAAQTGDRPTWKLGERAHAAAGSRRGAAKDIHDPLSIFGKDAKPAQTKLGRTCARMNCRRCKHWVWMRMQNQKMPRPNIKCWSSVCTQTPIRAAAPTKKH